MESLQQGGTRDITAPTLSPFQQILNSLKRPASPIGQGQGLANEIKGLAQWKTEPQTMGAQAPVNTPTPTPTSVPQSAGQQPLPIRIAIPSANGPGETVVPQDIADILFRVFEPYKQATNAAEVMHHPMQVSGLPEEIARGKNDFGNRGENPEFNPLAENTWNYDGSVDHGLMQNNSGTFDGMMEQPFWRNAMQKRGINSFEDLLDPEKSAEMSLLTLMRGNWDRENQTMKENPKWTQWYAAPRRLR